MDYELVKHRKHKKLISCYCSWGVGGGGAERVCPQSTPGAAPGVPGCRTHSGRTGRSERCYVNHWYEAPAHLPFFLYILLNLCPDSLQRRACSRSHV